MDTGKDFQPAASAQRRRRDDGAMPNGHRSNQDLIRRPPIENDFGMTTSRRSTSPVAAVNRSSDVARERERGRNPAPHHQHHRHAHHDAPRRRSIEPSRLDSGRRRHSRNRSPETASHTSGPSRYPPRGHREPSREPRRRRDLFDRSPDRPYPDLGPSRRRVDTPNRFEPNRPRRLSRSPVPSKRLRSPDLSFGGLEPRKSRRRRSPTGQENSSDKSLHPIESRRRAPLSPQRPLSPESHDRRYKFDKRSNRSRSPAHRRPQQPSRGDSIPPLRREHAPRQRSTSPRRRDRTPPPPEHRRRSRSRRRTTPQWGGRATATSDSRSYRRSSPDPGARAPPSPQRASPRGRRESTSDHKSRGIGESRAPPPNTGSEAASVDTKMAARGGFRPGFNPQRPYNSGYSQSSGHGTPNSSYHGSPPAQSPYHGGGRGWNTQPQYPQKSVRKGFDRRLSANTKSSPYAAPYTHNIYGPPPGPQAHYHQNQGHSPPYPPSGPLSQYPQAPYRGGHRGGPSAFRGTQLGTGRGGHRGNFKPATWNTNSSGAASRIQPGSEDEIASSHNSNHASPNNPNISKDQEDVQMKDSENLFRPPKDLQVEDTSKHDSSKDDPTAQNNRAPPTGPQSQTPNKFSFSMKNASKPAVAAPRPEISSKFNAAPVPREPPPKAPQKPAPPPQKPDYRGGFPRNVPTEPASARNRPSDRRPPEPSRLPEPQPKTRRVKKIMKRLKAKPTLPPDLAKSKSVFFRRPGNESVVGSGTYGKVFKGLHVYTKKLVALKRIRMEGERDGFPVTAVREIKLLRSLKHENIVQLQEVMVEGNECFMVFEYLSHDLTGLLHNPNYTLDPAQKKHMAQQLFRGLDYLHTRGVLHRDIKAANILVSSEGILKLADFGLARFYAKRHQLDYTNRVITIWYRSPELLLGETQYSAAVDIWSAACVMMEIFTKRPIFPGDGSEPSQLEMIYNVLGTPTRSSWPGLVHMPWYELLRADYSRPSAFVDKYKELLTPDAFDLLAAMFRYDPAKRPTASQVLEHAYFVTEQPQPRQAIE